MQLSALSSVVDDFEDQDDGASLYIPDQPLYQRPSHARSRNNAIAAHAKRRQAAKRAVNSVVSLHHKQGGRVRDQQEFETLRERASRLIAKSGMLGLRTDLTRVLTPKAKKGLSRVS